MSDHGSTEERELKFGEVELDRVRECLRELDAERTAPSALEDNWIFDRDGDLERAGSILRLRINNRGASLTYKGAPRFEDSVKVREERETEVGDAEEMMSILRCLGYTVSRRYQKAREEWRLGGVVICLDHTPIGDFVEFEGRGAVKVAERCDLDPGAAERRSYLELYEDYLAENPGAPEDMVFPDAD